MNHIKKTLKHIKEFKLYNQNHKIINLDRLNRLGFSEVIIFSKRYLKTSAKLVEFIIKYEDDKIAISLIDRSKV